MMAIFGGLDCGSAPNHAIQPSSLDRACVRDSDCVAVYEGPLSCCGLGECANAAINVANLARYMQVLAERRSTCEPAPSFPFIPCLTSSFVRCTEASGLLSADVAVAIREVQQTHPEGSAEGS